MAIMRVTPPPDNGAHGDTLLRALSRNQVPRSKKTLAGGPLKNTRIGLFSWPSCVSRPPQWRDQFLAAGQAGLKSRAPDPG